MSKTFWYGTVRKTASGAIQYVRNIVRKKDFLLISGKHGDIWVPLDTVYKALEDHWTADCTDRADRHVNTSDHNERKSK